MDHLPTLNAYFNFEKKEKTKRVYYIFCLIMNRNKLSTVQTALEIGCTIYGTLMSQNTVFSTQYRFYPTLIIFRNTQNNSMPLQIPDNSQISCVIREEIVQDHHKEKDKSTQKCASENIKSFQAALQLPVPWARIFRI